MSNLLNVGSRKSQNHQSCLSTTNTKINLLLCSSKLSKFLDEVFLFWFIEILHSLMHIHKSLIVKYDIICINLPFGWNYNEMDIFRSRLHNKYMVIYCHRPMVDPIKYIYNKDARMGGEGVIWQIYSYKNAYSNYMLNGPTVWYCPKTVKYSICLVIKRNSIWSLDRSHVM